MCTTRPSQHPSLSQGLALIEVLLALILVISAVVMLLPLTARSLESSRDALATLLAHQAQANLKIEQRLQRPSAPPLQSEHRDGR
jgi:Tfp pilus assembly protein PilV